MVVKLLILTVVFCTLVHYGKSTGVCPKPPPFDPVLCARILISPGCKTDRDCRRKGMKCCPAGRCHVKKCVKPVPICPKQMYYYCKRYKDECKLDRDCKRGEMCCYSRKCGRICVRRRRIGR